MHLANLEQIFGALQSAEVRYLVVGGLAVVAHGYLRTTKDLDLVIALDEVNTRRAMQALTHLGFKPKVPVSAEAFADASTRRRWIEEKGMVVFQLISDRFRFEPIDVFVTEPFDFDREYGRATWKELNRELRVPFVDIAQLLEMKRAAGRPQDLADIAELEAQRGSD
jgi:hypothetical protein